MKRRFFLYGVGLVLAALILLAAGALYYGHSVKNKKKPVTPTVTAPTEPEQIAADASVTAETPVEDTAPQQADSTPEVVPTPPEPSETPEAPEITPTEPQESPQEQEAATTTPAETTDVEPAPEPVEAPTPEPEPQPAEPAEEKTEVITFSEDVQSLLDSLSKPVPANRFPLIKAVEKGDMEQARQLLADGASLNEQDVAGFTALAAAIQANQTEAALWLIEQKADVNLPDVLGVTPLMRAARLGNPKLVRKLLECGADKTLKDLWQNSSYAYAKDGGNDEVLLLLVD